MSNETITLKTKFSDGTGGEAKLYHMAQFNAEHVLLSPAPTLVAASNQSAFVQAFTHATDATLAVDAVDIRAVGKCPVQTTSCIVTISDGRTVNGVPVTYVITVMIAQNPDLSSVEVSSSDPVRGL